MNSTFISDSELKFKSYAPFIVLDRMVLSNVLQMSNEELDEKLRRFYAEARTQTGQEYRRLSLLGFRNSIERHFIANNGRSLKLTGNPEFALSNKMLESQLKALRREGKENVQHKAVIDSQYLIKLNNSPFMSPNTSAGLLRKVWVLFARCTGVEEVVKASVYSAEIASSYRKTQMVLIMSRCPMKSCQRIIKEASPTNRATRDRPACIAQVRTAMRFLAFASTSTSSTQGSRLSFKSQGKSSNSPIQCGLRTSHLESTSFRQS